MEWISLWENFAFFFFREKDENIDAFHGLVLGLFGLVSLGFLLTVLSSVCLSFHIFSASAALAMPCSHPLSTPSAPSLFWLELLHLILILLSLFLFEYNLWSTFSCYCPMLLCWIKAFFLSLSLVVDPVHLLLLTCHRCLAHSCIVITNKKHCSALSKVHKKRRCPSTASHGVCMPPFPVLILSWTNELLAPGQQEIMVCTLRHWANWWSVSLCKWILMLSCHHQKGFVQHLFCLDHCSAGKSKKSSSWKVFSNVSLVPSTWLES